MYYRAGVPNKKFKSRCNKRAKNEKLLGRENDKNLLGKEKKSLLELENHI